MRHMVQTGNFSSLSFSQADDSMPLRLAVANRLCIAAARLPARSLPANNQFSSQWRTIESHYPPGRKENDRQSDESAATTDPYSSAYTPVHCAETPAPG